MDKIDESFRILDLKPGASLDEIKKAYKDLLWIWHPDRFPENHHLHKKALEQTKKINSAFEIAKAYVPDIHHQSRIVYTFRQSATTESACNQSRPKGEDRKPERNYSKPAKAKRPIRLRTATPKVRHLEGLLVFLLTFVILVLFGQPKTPTNPVLSGNVTGYPFRSASQQTSSRQAFRQPASDTPRRPLNTVNSAEKSSSVNTPPPRSAHDYYKLGNEHFTKGRYKEAAKCFDEAIELNHHFSEAFTGLAISYYKLGRTEDAMTICESLKLFDKKSAEKLLATIAQMQKD